MYDIPEVEIDFNGSYKSTAHLCSKATRSRLNFLLLERTPSSLQYFLSSNSGLDTALQYLE